MNNRFGIHRISWCLEWYGRKRKKIVCHKLSNSNRFKIVYNQTGSNYFKTFRYKNVFFFIGETVCTVASKRLIISHFISLSDGNDAQGSPFHFFFSFIDVLFLVVNICLYCIRYRALCLIETIQIKSRQNILLYRRKIGCFNVNVDC